MRQEQIERMENIINKDYANMAGMVIMKDGEAVYEKYFNGCTEANRIRNYSVTREKCP